MRGVGAGMASSPAHAVLLLPCRATPQMYTQLGVVTKGTVIEVNVSELGLVTPGGKVVWGKYAQVRVVLRGCEDTHMRGHSVGALGAYVHRRGVLACV